MQEHRLTTRWHLKQNVTDVRNFIMFYLIVKLRLYVLVFMTDFKIHYLITTGACQLAKCQLITTGCDLDVEKLFRSLVHWLNKHSSALLGVSLLLVL